MQVSISENKILEVSILSILWTYALPFPSFADEPSKPTTGASQLDGQIIITTGATNPGKSTIQIEPDGSAALTNASGGGKSTGKLSSALLQRLISDLKKAMPLNQLPAAHEIKSASFGKRTFITYAGQHSPDIESDNPSDARVQALKTDINLVLQELSPQTK